MTATDLDTFTAITEALTFTAACQHHQHPNRHADNDPAAWAIWTRCPRCQSTRDYLLCESGRVAMWHPHTIGCRRAECGATGVWTDFVLMLIRIPGANT